MIMQKGVPTHSDLLLLQQLGVWLGVAHVRVDTPHVVAPRVLHVEVLLLG